MNKNPIRCDVCGKFIAYDDLDSGRASHRFTPDSDYSTESHEFACPVCVGADEPTDDDMDLDDALYGEWPSSLPKD